MERHLACCLKSNEVTCSLVIETSICRNCNYSCPSLMRTVRCPVKFLCFSVAAHLDFTSRLTFSFSQQSGSLTLDFSPLHLTRQSRVIDWLNRVSSQSVHMWRCALTRDTGTRSLLSYLPSASRLCIMNQITKMAGLPRNTRITFFI